MTGKNFALPIPALLGLVITLQFLVFRHAADRNCVSCLNRRICALDNASESSSNFWEKVFTKVSQQSCKVTYLREKCHI